MAFVNAVYYPSWRVYKGKAPSCIRADSVTHVFYAFLRVSEDGTIRHLDEFCDLQKNVDGCQGCLAALGDFKHRNPGIKTIISVGGGSGSGPFPVLAANPKARSILARSLVEFCGKHGFDGVDVDWEHPTSADDGANFVRLLQDIRQAMSEDCCILTTALPTGEYCLKNIILAELGNIVSFLNLMTYDFSGPWTATSSHHAQLWSADIDMGLASGSQSCAPSKSCARGVDYVLSRGFPPHKIILGVPVYARFFPSARGPSDAFADGGEMEYNELPDEWIMEAANVDEVAGAASVVDEVGGRGFVSFDVPRTVELKARYVREQGLGGMFYWTATGDREDGWSLVASGYQHQLQYSQGTD